LRRTGGWSYKGGFGWRTRVIYETNLRTAYQAGRYKQMAEPDMLKRRPWWQYKHSGSVNFRPEHKRWDGLVLRADDEWWKIHYPPNGWGCDCYVNALNERDLKRLGKDGADSRPLEVPGEVEEAWAYNVGEAAWGKPIALRSAEELQVGESGRRTWERISHGTRQDAGAPLELRREAPEHPLLPYPRDRAEAERFMREWLGCEEKVIPLGDPPWGVDVVVNVAALAKHLPDIDLKRTAYFPWAMQVLEHPQELWLAFFRSLSSGKVTLRATAIGAIAEKGGRPMLCVADVQGGALGAYTFYPASEKAVNDSRGGMRIMAGKAS